MRHRLAVFSGFDTRFVEQLKRTLHAQQTTIVFTKTNEIVDEQYFDTLLTRTLDFLDDVLAKQGAHVVAILASCIEHPNLLEMERRSFFPSFRRLGFPAAFKRDTHKSSQVANKIINTLSSEEFLATFQQVRPSSGILALPLLNAESRKLRAEMENLYELRSLEPGSSLSKEVVRMRGCRTFRIKGIDFTGRVNHDGHPVRRCTDTVQCDVAARLRLGFSMPQRFEFDVTCENGLAGKEFRLCDGSSQTIPSGTTHLNMRINDDFKYALRS